MKRRFEYFLQFDWMLLLAATTLTVIGLMAIYGIGVARESATIFQFKKQLIAASIGWVIVFMCVFVDYRNIRAFAIPIYSFGAVLLGGVLLFGRVINGTRGWFVIGNLSFQPVEFAKIALAVFLASYLSRHVHTRLGWIPLCGSAAATGLYIALVMAQPDFGSAVVLAVIWFAAVVFAGLPRRAWIVALLAIGLLSPLMWNFGLKPYQRARFSSFINPALDPRGAGYNVTQARIAVGSGGLWGKGIGEGSQSRLRFLPEASTDFIFSVIGEDLGFVGITIVLLLFGLLLWRFLRIARTSYDPFAHILLIALLMMFLFHLFVNAGMNLGIMPVTGIPLPFVSAAASSLLVAFLAIGLAQSIAVRRLSVRS